MKTAVALLACDAYQEPALTDALIASLAPAGGIAALIRPGERVLLKPNFVVARPADAAVNTHPAVIEAVARLCLDCGARVAVADSPAIGSAQAVAGALGLAERLQPLGVPIIDLSRSVKVVRHLPLSRCTVVIAREVLEADAVINLAKLKVHQQLTLTLAVKNLFGAVVARRKALLHALLGREPERFGLMLLEVAALVRPRYSIVDGIVGLEKNGPTRGTPRRFGLLCAGAEPVAVDTVLCELLGVDPATVPVLAAARRRDWGPWRLDQIDLRGASIDQLRVRDLQLAISMPIGFSLGHLLRGLAKQALAYYRERRARCPQG